MLKTKLLKKSKVKCSPINWTFDEISVSIFFRVDTLNLHLMSKDGKYNDSCLDDYYKMQDAYLQFNGGDSFEMKRYKALCIEYYNKLIEYNSEPKLIGKILTEVNDLSIQKQKMQDELFTNEVDSLDYEKLVAQVSLRLNTIINPDEMRVKYFFNIIKAINDGTKDETN